MIRLNLEKTPFSRRGSHYLIARRRKADGTTGLFIRTLRASAHPREIFEILVIVDGTPAEFTEEASPEKITLTAAGGEVQITMDSADGIRLRSRNVGVRLRRRRPDDGEYNVDSLFFRDERHLQVNAYRAKEQYMLSLLSGSLQAHAPWEQITCAFIEVDCVPDVNSGIGELSVEGFESSWKGEARSQPDAFEECARSCGKLFREWLDATPGVQGLLSETRILAAYTQYIPLVEPYRLFTRPLMLISPSFNGIWSWDHCFNAIALSCRQPELAWEQFIAPFDYQNEDGALPDYANDREAVYNFTKPPIHGWALLKLMERMSIGHKALRGFYPRLIKWTEWWFRYRDDNRNGIPQYNHGNDSGWDNATIFKEAGAVESPDLLSYLALQMEALSVIAEALDLETEAGEWRRRSRELIGRLVSSFWDGNGFVAKRSDTGAVIDSASLILLMPLLLGSRLPADIVQKGAAQLRSFLTEWGLATERPDSGLFRERGYWRGPVWAPPTFMMVDGLRNASEHELSGEIAARFCALCQKGGMAENFHPFTGEGLGDPAYTWTASVFLILAEELMKEPAE